MKASAQGETDIVITLLDSNADVNAIDKLVSVVPIIMNIIVLLMVIVLIYRQNQQSALHKAARSVHKDVVEVLVEKGAKIELKDKVFFTHIMGVTSAAIILFKSLKNGNTPLHLAVMHGQTAVVKYLVAKGANLSARNDVSIPIYFHTTYILIYNTDILV